jgi:hypothetical protein
VSSRGTKQVPLSQVRQGIRRGLLRVRIARARSSALHARRKGNNRGKHPTLVIETGDPGSSSPPPSGAPPASVTSLEDAAAAAKVVPRPESQPANSTANHYMPTPTELTAFHSAADKSNSLMKRVTGGFTGTTDEILQWAAYKWGISPDILRAVAVVESNWNQAAMGDRRDGVDASKYPAQSRIDSDSVYESLGIMQIKWRPDGSVNPGSEPLRWKSTAFNADIWGASVHYYYDGLCTWCGSGYSAGQLWESIGAHFQPTPWRNSGQMNYISRVQSVMAAAPWPH